MNFWDWLNDNAGAMQVLFASMLSLVTAVYALCTYFLGSAARRQAAASIAMAQEMRDQRLESMRPLLVVDHQLHGRVGNAPTLVGSFRNVGPGAALKVEYSFQHPRFAYYPLWCPALGPQDKYDHDFLSRKAADDRDVDTPNGTLAHIVLTYEDVFHRLFETSVTLEQNYLGWTERGTAYRMIADHTDKDRGPPSPNVWHEFRTTPSGSVQVVPHDP